MGESGVNLTTENMLIGYIRIQNVAIRLSKQERKGIYNELNFLGQANPSQSSSKKS